MAFSPSTTLVPIKNYRLYWNNMLIMKQNDSGIFRIPRIGLDQEGTYTCVPETHMGLGRNKTLRLYVKAAPQLCEQTLQTTSFNSSSYAPPTAKPVSLTRRNESASTDCSVKEFSTSTSFAVVLTWLIFFLLVQSVYKLT